MKNYPEKILKNIMWEFIDVETNSKDGFIDFMTTYQIFRHSQNVWNPNKIALNSKAVSIYYDTWYVGCDEDDDDYNQRIKANKVFHADDGMSFTEGELFYKIYDFYITELDGVYHRWFEGLSFMDINNNNYPRYYMHLGS